MKKYDVKPEKPSGGRETLPAGGYVCSILNAKVESNDWGYPGHRARCLRG